jgi:hypothetical protein
MKTDFLKKLLLQPGAIISLTLIGILLLSAVLYYRAVKIQRFLEPALAITTPRIKFEKTIRHLMVQEFGSEDIAGIRFAPNALFVEGSLLTTNVHVPYSGSPVLKKLSRVFLVVLKDETMKNAIDLILVRTRDVESPDRVVNKKRKLRSEQRADLIVNSLYQTTPELEREYGRYFATTAVLEDSPEKGIDWIEFRFIPTERLHIEVLQSLKKYVH